MKRLVVWAMLLRPSKEMPLVSAASPKMQTTFSSDPALIARGAHAQRRRERRAGVPRAVAIVLAFRPQGKAVQTIRRANGVKPVLAPGQQFMDVTLMAHVPDKLVVRRGKDAVQRDGQFDHAQIRAEVAAVLGQFGDQFVADLRRQLAAIVPDVNFLTCDG